MPRNKISDQEFIALWNNFGSITQIAKQTGFSERAIARRRRRLEARYDMLLESQRRKTEMVVKSYSPEMEITLKDGVFVIGSDAHYWPESISAGHKAFVAVINHLKPDYVVLNGDICDFPQISSHHKIGWETRPTLKSELEAVQDRLAEIEKVAGNAKLIRTIGNHDSRFDSRLSHFSPEYEGIMGTRLSDHLPRWTETWAIRVNGECQIKHRWHNGIHATYNNTLKSGISIVTGHLHSLKVTPWTDLRGDRYGVDTGTLADINSPQFHYMEATSRNWRSGFAVLTFKDGKLMPPELCQVIDDSHAYFRGSVFALEV